MKTYQQRKEEIRESAIFWNSFFETKCWGYGEIAEIQANFERLGRRYGLLREFRENGIC